MGKQTMKLRRTRSSNPTREQQQHLKRVAAEPGPVRALVVTLDAAASRCVCEFADEFAEEINDVASGVVLDALPQALQSWRDTKRRKGKNLVEIDDYYRGCLSQVWEARRRRLRSAAANEGARAQIAHVDDFLAQLAEKIDNVDALTALEAVSCLLKNEASAVSNSPKS